MQFKEDDLFRFGVFEIMVNLEFKIKLNINPNSSILMQTFRFSQISTIPCIKYIETELYQSRD